MHAVARKPIPATDWLPLRDFSNEQSEGKKITVCSILSINRFTESLHREHRAACSQVASSIRRSKATNLNVERGWVFSAKRRDLHFVLKLSVSGVSHAVTFPIVGYLLARECCELFIELLIASTRVVADWPQCQICKVPR